MSTQQLTEAIRKWCRLPVTDPDFLKEYEKEQTWAPKHGITKRTSQRYRNKERPGLPFLLWGGEVWIHKPGGAEFIAARVGRRNQRRRAGAELNAPRNLMRRRRSEESAARS
jgi:hypothetical protein